MKLPARAIVGNLVWSTDSGVWAVWQVAPFAHAHTTVVDKLAVHGRLRSLLSNLPDDSMLLSVCERLDPLDVVLGMAEGIDLTQRQAWSDVCEVTNDWLAEVDLYRRRYYVATVLPGTRRGWRDILRTATGEVTTPFGIAPNTVAPAEVEQRQRQARDIETRLGSQVPLTAVSAGELCWLYARSLRREAEEPPLDQSWEPPFPGDRDGRQRDGERFRPRGVLAQLADAVVKEGGYPEDDDRPRHRRYVRIDSAGGVSFQTVLAMSDMPHFFRFPGGGGEWLFYADHVGFPLDWCVRIRSVKNTDAQAKVRRKHRDLVGQMDEYDGDLTGAPPQLAEAIQAIDTERSELGANPMEAELQATILFSIAAPTLTELEERAGAVEALFEPQEYGLGRPTGGQGALLRSMLPGSSAAPVCRDYTQFMLARDLAAGSPFCGPEAGDPTGLLLGVSLDGGTGTPVLFDPAYGPKVNTSPSLAAIGRLGSGKSFFLKRLCWDTVARGGQVVTIDRTRSGEYVRFAASIAGKAQVVKLEPGADVCLDPLKSFGEDDRVSVTLGFLSLLGGCSTHSDEGAALAEAVDTIAERPEAGLGDVVDELERMGAEGQHPDLAARSLARRLSVYRRSGAGQLAFGDGQPLSLDADLIVFWAPNLTLPDRETLDSEFRSRQMLPEQVLGQAILYLVAAVGRQVVFRDPSRFAAALYDEAWALLASPYGQNLLIEGVRDGRKHNGAIWLASQHPNDFAVEELLDLLGARFVFRQARQAIPAALQFLGVPNSVDAGTTLEQGLGNGQCLFRDVRDRVGLVQVLPPAHPELEAAFETAPDAESSQADGVAVSLPDAAASLLGGDGLAGLGAGGGFEMLELEQGDDAGETSAVPAVDYEEEEAALVVPVGADYPPALGPPEADSAGVGADLAAARQKARRRRGTPLGEALREREQGGP